MERIREEKRREGTKNIGDKKNSGFGIRRTGDVGIESTNLVNVTRSCIWIQCWWV